MNDQEEHMGMLDAGDTVALVASQGDVSPWPSDTRITATLAYRDV